MNTERLDAGNTSWRKGSGSEHYSSQQVWRVVQVLLSFLYRFWRTFLQVKMKPTGTFFCCKDGMRAFNRARNYRPVKDDIYNYKAVINRKINCSGVASTHWFRCLAITELSLQSVRLVLVFLLLRLWGSFHCQSWEQQWLFATKPSVLAWSFRPSAKGSPCISHWSCQGQFLSSHFWLGGAVTRGHCSALLVESYFWAQNSTPGSCHVW